MNMSVWDDLGGILDSGERSLPFELLVSLNGVIVNFMISKFFSRNS